MDRQRNFARRNHLQREDSKFGALITNLIALPIILIIQALYAVVAWPYNIVVLTLIVLSDVARILAKSPKYIYDGGFALAIPRLIETVTSSSLTLCVPLVSLALLPITLLISTIEAVSKLVS